MIKTLLFIVVTALFVASVLWLAEHPGHVLLTSEDWELGISLPFFAFTMFAVSVLAALCYRFWRGIRRVPAATKEFLQRRRKENGYRALTQGMVAVAAGDADEAARQAKRANSLLSAPPLTMLLSAQAAQINGDEAAAERYFSAMLKSEETAFLGLRGLLIQAQRNGQVSQALPLARRAYALRPKTPWVLETLLELQVSEGHWEEALGIVNQAKRCKAISSSKVAQYSAALLLVCSEQAQNTGDIDNALIFARRAHGYQQNNFFATLRYASLLAAAGKRRAVIKLIEDAWPKAPDVKLAGLYGDMEESSDPLKKVKKLERLYNLNPDHPESRIAFAQALLEAKIWGAARTHLEFAGGDKPSARICRLMAQLEEDENGNMDAVRAWLLKATFADPDPTWICSDCGAAFDRWVPVCSRCDALGALDWLTPKNVTSIAHREGNSVLGSQHETVLVDNRNQILDEENLVELGEQGAANSLVPRSAAVDNSKR